MLISEANQNWEGGGTQRRWTSWIHDIFEEHTTKTKVSLLLYVDDLQVICKTEEELQKQMQAVRTFNDDIHMEFGLDKCTEIVLSRGKWVHSQNLIFDFTRDIQDLEQGKIYTYLQIEDSEGMQHDQMKDWRRNTPGD